jgi:hypothetical protein
MHWWGSWSKLYYRLGDWRSGFCIANVLLLFCGLGAVLARDDGLCVPTVPLERDCGDGVAPVTLAGLL